MDNEIWAPSPSLAGFEISSHGRVKRNHFTSNGRPPRVLKGTTFNSGYRYVQPVINGVNLTIAIHRLVCEAFNGPCPSDKDQVRHLNGIKTDNSPVNLAWGTAKENAFDRRIHGHDYAGSEHASSTIDEMDVIAIFCLRRRSYTGEEIGRLFNLDRNQINKIISRKCWSSAYIPDDLATAALKAQERYRGETSNV